MLFARRAARAAIAAASFAVFHSSIEMAHAATEAPKVDAPKAEAPKKDAKPGEAAARAAIAAASFAVFHSSIEMAHAATEAPKAEAPKKDAKPGEAAAKAASHWYEKIKIRGYTQVRYNQLGATNERLVNTQGDRSIGKDGGILIRRARLIVFGDVHPHLSVYLQTDFASVVSDQSHVPTMRDWYADIFLDKKKEFRFRVGQSKVPYGFENMQSSQNRAPFDRSDALNSAVKDERDLGAFFYWAPDKVRKRYKHLVDDGLKGSGDYGVAALGIFNGQTANQKEKNATPHVVARLAWPFQIGKQIVELGAGAYAGKFVVKTANDVEAPEGGVRDFRAHASFVLYPQPIGFQAEYNIGRGPELSGDRIVEKPLSGGYAMLLAKIGDFVPYVRGVYYEGARKFETNAPHYSVREVELGLEYRVFEALELTAAYTFAERTHPEAPYPQEKGRFARLQLQFNY